MRQWCILSEHYSLLIFLTLPLKELRRFSNWLFLRRQAEHKTGGRRHCVSFYMKSHDKTKKVFRTEVWDESGFQLTLLMLRKLRIMPIYTRIFFFSVPTRMLYVLFFFFLFTVVESIMRGENVGITPRRSRSSAVLTQQQPVSDLMDRIIILLLRTLKKSRDRWVLIFVKLLEMADGSEADTTFKHQGFASLRTIMPS
jgi:hypothetical protein